MGYKNVSNLRSKIRSGDLLAWSQDPNKNGKIFRFLPIVRFLTASDFGHVGIAYVKEDGVYVYEATMPEVKLRKIDDSETFYCCSMKFEWSDSAKEWLDDKLGCKYSVLDGIRAYLGIVTKRDDRWQCAELARDFYCENGIDLNCHPTPTAVVNEAMFQRSATLVKINR